MTSYGVGSSNTIIGADRTSLRDFAQAIEGMGYEFVVAYDHIFLPLQDAKQSRRILHPGTMPLLEAVTTAMFITSVTEKLRVRLSVLVPAIRRVPVLAKQLATVDILSGGRIDIGIGAGWLRYEWDALQVPFAERGPRTDEAVRLLKTAWMEPEITFRGKYDAFESMAMEPKPLTKPHPPLWFGGASRASVRRVLQDGVGYIPSPVTPRQGSHEVWLAIRREAAAYGRNPDKIRLNPTVHVDDPGSAEQSIIDELARGATDVTIMTGGARGDVPFAEHVRLLEDIIVRVNR